jgi:hypothetical protein
MSIEDEVRIITAKVQVEMDLANDERMAYPIQKPIGFRSWTAWIREQENNA